VYRNAKLNVYFCKQAIKPNFTNELYLHRIKYKNSDIKTASKQITYTWREVVVVDIKIGRVIWAAHFWDERCFTYSMS